MAFRSRVASAGFSGSRGPWNVRLIQRTNASWLTDYDSMELRVASQIGDSMIYFAQNTKKVINRTGRLKGGWKKRIRRGKNRVDVRMFSNVKHAFFQENGTGLWGPRQDYIYPRQAPRLRWKTPGGQWVSARRVKGVPAKFIGKHAHFEGWAFGRNKFKREATSLAGKY